MAQIILILLITISFVACKGEEATPQKDASAIPKQMIHCSHCHSLQKGEEHKIGPNLFGIVGKQVGSIPAYPYTEELKKGKWLWTRDNLDLLINKSRGSTKDAIKKLSGNPDAKSRMFFYGTKDDDSQIILDYLETLKD